MYTPFLTPRPAPEIHGVYRNKETKNIMILMKMRLQGFIDDKDQPYDGYRGKIFLESENRWISKCIITPETLAENWEKITSL